MGYLVSFLEGVITFISPCLLPMLPTYLSYFAGSSENGDANKKKGRIAKNAVGFVLGFTLLFVAMGAFAGSLGAFLSRYSTGVNIVSGILVILFGLSFLGLFQIPFLNGGRQIRLKSTKNSFFSAVLFGMVFAIGWTPCVGAFLGSALMLAAQAGHTLKGVLMLLSFSLGLGIPFIASAFLISSLSSAFNFIKKNYRLVNIISGSILILTGILMATGLMGYYLSLLSF